MSITIYGIRNCDTMKRARGWLDEHKVDHVFHDYRVQGLAAERLQRWVDEVGWEVLLNRAGTTFRKLYEEEKVGLDESRAKELMIAQPALVKRPVLEAGDRGLIVGFRAEAYQPVFAGTAD